MMLSRRGFLTTTVAALAGTAVFEPLTKLWLPQSLSAAPLVTPVDLGGRSLTAVTDELLELDAFATRCATLLAERWTREQANVLYDMQFRQIPATEYNTTAAPNSDSSIKPREPVYAGFVTPELLVDGLGPGTFQPDGRQAVVVESYVAADELVRCFTQLWHGQRPRPSGMFAPMGRTLAQGQDFSDDVRVGIGVDPWTGLSVRVLRFADKFSSRRQLLEVSGGTWKPHRERYSRVMFHKSPILSSGPTVNDAYALAMHGTAQRRGRRGKRLQRL